MPHDYLSDKAANYKLMEDIRSWWRKRGVVVKVWLEKAIDPTTSSTIHVIRTNIVQDCTNLKGHYIVE